MLVRCLLIIALLLAPASAQVGGLAFPGPGPIVATSSGLALDGSGQGTNNGTASSFTIPVTTANGSGVIVCGVAVSTSETLTSLTATGLTFVQRGTAQTGGGNIFYEYTVPYTTNFSGSITANLSNTTYAAGICFGISGAPSSGYFDTNVSLPGVTTTAAAATGTTSNSPDFVFSMNSVSNNTVTAGSGWTIIQNSTNFFIAQYQLAASAGSFIGNISNNSAINVGVLDAIK